MFVEALGPVVEFLRLRRRFLFFWSLGLIGTDVAVLFFLFAVVWGMWINLGSIFLDNLLNRRYGSLRDILKLYFFSVLELYGLPAAHRPGAVQSYVSVQEKGWGKPKRQKIKERGLAGNGV
ncbi:MAG: hypothetical protein MZW92_71535 [Comamonadaceae bacterium]|nr:hypothetical protein [Comamonadaceae bacterium]